ncbi:hypothetical protein [Streptacidiphilus anmyonensis]|uniref:hypothetical protein n=1 Tax=Streptacidiphilus anmyonensis TaxID=405782 RepID=UPI0005A82DC8|nr:hypothetical protein [Streptacidiphilus anmyonensis]
MDPDGGADHGAATSREAMAVSQHVMTAEKPRTDASADVPYHRPTPAPPVAAADEDEAELNLHANCRIAARFLT